MPRKFLSLLFFLVFLFLPPHLFAAGFQLTHIGSLDVTGTTSSEWWFTTANPTLTGIATAASPVTVTVDSTSQTVTADSSGNWSAATTTAEGDHSVALESGGSTISFTLHIGAVPTGISAPQASNVPVAGSVAPTFIIIGSGLAIFLAGFLIKKFATRKI